MVEKVLIFGESLIKHKKKDGPEYYTESLTGYSRVTNAIAFRLADMGFDVDIADYAVDEGPITVATPFSQKSIVKVHGIGLANEDYPSFGRHRLPHLLKIIKPGLLILVGDLRMYEYVGDIPDCPDTIVVLPVDGSPVPRSWIHILEKFDEIVTCSQFGYNELQKAGIESNIIPFGVDPHIYFPLPGDAIKEAKTSADLPEGKWIWQYVGRNQARKNLPDLFLAYKKFNEIYPGESVLFVHSHPKDKVGWDLFDLARYDGIANNVRFTQQFFDTTQPILNAIYNVADCHVSMSLSEGFGLTCLESMATGKPQIVPDHTVLSELVRPNCGELVKTEREMMGTALVHEYLPSIDDFVKKMIRIYENPGIKEWYARNALERAKKYSWDLIARDWVKLLEGF